MLLIFWLFISCLLGPLGVVSLCCELHPTDVLIAELLCYLLENTTVVPPDPVQPYILYWDPIRWVSHPALCSLLQQSPALSFKWRNMRFNSVYFSMSRDLLVFACGCCAAIDGEGLLSLISSCRSRHYHREMLDQILNPPTLKQEDCRGIRNRQSFCTKCLNWREPKKRVFIINKVY